MKVSADFGPQSAEWSQVLALDLQFMPQPWSETQWRELNSHDRVCLLIEDEALVGFALHRLSPWEGLAHLFKITLHPDHRGGGKAQKFWLEQEDYLRTEKIARVFLEVAVSNTTAAGFYRKLGFQILRRIPGFYSNGDEAFSMEKLI